MKEHIAFLSYDGLTDPLGQSQILPYMIGLSEKFHVHIVSFEKSEFGQQTSEIKGIISPHSIEWHPLTYTKTPPVLSTLYDLYQLNKKVKQLIKNYDLKVLHCRSYITSLVGLGLSKKYKLKWIFDMRGFWADERIEGGIWNPNSFIFNQIYKFFKNKEQEFVHQSDHIISLTNSGKKVLENWKVQGDKISVIPCSADFKHFDPSSLKEELIKEYQASLNIKENDKILLYLGSFSTWYQLDKMLLFFKQLIKKDSSYKFLFVTKEDPKIIERTCNDLSIDFSRLIIRKANRKEVPYYIHLSKFSIAFISPVFSKKGSSATKIAEILAMNKTMVVNDIGDNQFLFSKYNFGVCIDNEKEIFDSEINQITNISHDLKIREEALDYFTLDRAIEIYTKAYEKVLSE